MFRYIIFQLNFESTLGIPVVHLNCSKTYAHKCVFHVAALSLPVLEERSELLPTLWERVSFQQS